MKKLLVLFSFMALTIGHTPIEAQEQFSSNQGSFEQQSESGMGFNKMRRRPQGQQGGGPGGRQGRQGRQGKNGGNLKQIQNQLVTLLATKGAKFEIDTSSDGVTVEITSEDKLVASKLSKLGKMLKLLQEIQEDDKKLKEQKREERKKLKENQQ